jgi:hypothetical protein
VGRTAQEEGPGSIDDTPLNRLIAERFEIEQHILANRGEQPEADDVEGGEIDERETFPES